MTYLAALCILIMNVFMSACSTLTPAQFAEHRTVDAARSCQYGTVRVDRVSNEGIPHMRPS